MPRLTSAELWSSFRPRGPTTNPAHQRRERCRTCRTNRGPPVGKIEA